jgi:hypothetical protein
MATPSSRACEPGAFAIVTPQHSRRRRTDLLRGCSAQLGKRASTTASCSARHTCTASFERTPRIIMRCDPPFIGQEAPVPRAVQCIGQISAVPVLGGSASSIRSALISGNDMVPILQLQDDLELLAENQVLGFEPRARFETRAQDAHHQYQPLSHRAAKYPISARPVIQIEFR